jgi:hypothetical protein
MSVPRLRSSQRWDVGPHRLLVSEDGLFSRELVLTLPVLRRHVSNRLSFTPRHQPPAKRSASPRPIGIPPRFGNWLRFGERRVDRRFAWRRRPSTVDDSMRSFSQTTQWAFRSRCPTSPRLTTDRRIGARGFVPANYTNRLNWNIFGRNQVVACG